MKFYKWALNEQTVTDFGSYIYTDIVDFDFQSKFSADYYSKYLDGNSVVTNSLNA